MKIALYHPWIYLKSGLERTLLEIGKRSRHEWTFYTSHFDAEGTYPELGGLDIREVNRVSVERSYGAVLGAAWQIARVKMNLVEERALVVSCDGLGTFATLRNRDRPVLNLCFTPLRAVYDEEYRKRHLARQSGLRLGMALLAERAYRMVDRWLWRRYDRVICVSEAVRRRVADGGLRPEHDLRVFYPGIDTDNVAVSDRTEDFFFLPGRIMWTKNLELGVRAFLSHRREAGSAKRLVIAGMVDAKSQGYLTQLKALAGDGQGVEFHLSPTDAEMARYYERCIAVLFTAFNEDLGLTPMEAMARGKPVIAVDRGGPREVVEDGRTGCLVPAEPDRFAAAMTSLVADPQRARDMGKAGAERVLRFGWDRFVRQLDDAIDEMVGAAPARA